ncbi:TIGR02710 family CRISPR-associated CARF protein [Methanocalculus sp. MC3]
MVTLFMTVGTGVGEDRLERMRNLAHGLAHGIAYLKADQLVFFGSQESHPMIEHIGECYVQIHGHDLPPHTWVQLKNIDSFSDCFEQIRDEIRKREGEEIRIDYTSGTKTMTMSAAIASMLHQKPLTFINGKRGSNGLVILGTESVSEQSLYLAYNIVIRDMAVAEFNAYRFDSAIASLKKLVAEEDKKELLIIAEAYRLWDRFDHAGAAALFDKIHDQKFNDNKGFVKQLHTATDPKYRYKLVLADLLNNAGRRIEEGKYDDATARLYRAAELVTQIRLLEYDIDDINGTIRLDLLKKKKMNPEYYARCEGRADPEGRLRLGIRDKFGLLEALGWTRAMRIYESIADDLTKRNSSILAHGITSVSEDDAKRLYEKILTLSKGSCGDNDIPQMIRRSKFEKL